MILEFYKCIFNAMYAQSLCSMIARHKWQTETVMFYIPKPSISGIGVGVDKKIPRHTESTLLDSALETLGSINLKTQDFPILWKGQLIPVLGYLETAFTSRHNSLSFHQPCSAQNQNISITSMYLLSAACRKHIHIGYKAEFGLVSGMDTRKFNPTFGTLPLFQV